MANRKSKSFVMEGEFIYTHCIIVGSQTIEIPVEVVYQLVVRDKIVERAHYQALPIYVELFKNDPRLKSSIIPLFPEISYAVYRSAGNKLIKQINELGYEIPESTIASFI